MQSRDPGRKARRRRSSAGGAAEYTIVVGSSMEAAFRTGDLLVGFSRTQGDNTADADLWRPQHRDILAVPVLRLPCAGYVLHWARSPLALAALGSILVGAVLWPHARRPDVGDAEVPAAATGGDLPVA